MVKGSELELTPSNVVTLTDAVPFDAIRLAGTCAVIDVGVPVVVERPWPFHLTTPPAGRLTPVTARVKAGPPKLAEAGESAVMTGAGLMVKVSAFDRKPSVVT